MPYALVGGLAVSARAEPRFTRDPDFAVAVADDIEAERVIREMVERGYRVIALVEQEATGRLAASRLSESDDERSTVVDLRFSSVGIEPEIVSTAEVIDVLPGVRLPVARVGYLIAAKLLARDDDQRPLDRADLGALAAVATDGDWRDARTAVALITERGHNRGRDLGAALGDLHPAGP